MYKKILKFVLAGLLVVGLVYAGLFFSDMYSYTKEVRLDLKGAEMNRLKSALEDGDIIFQTSKSNQSKAIQIATNSKYSHVGIVYWQGVNLFVYEAVQPVKMTKLSDWIERGKNRKYVVKRLKNSKTILTPENLSKMKVLSDRFKDKNYDIHFEWSDDKIYCSELVWKIYKEALNIEIGDLQELKDFNLDAPAVRKKMTERYGNDMPMNEIVISPASIFASDKLVTVMKN